MASQISPGVIVKERDLTTGTVVNSAATNAAVVSTFQKGPVGEITQISSQRELVDTFGSPGDSNADDFFVASEFLNYGGRLGVVRAETGQLTLVQVRSSKTRQTTNQELSKPHQHGSGLLEHLVYGVTTLMLLLLTVVLTNMLNLLLPQLE